MALFVQIDHFRKTDQKPTVKNHLFSISWFRSFNRTSFQQQLKLEREDFAIYDYEASIVHPFNNNWNNVLPCGIRAVMGFNRTSFQQQLKQTITGNFCLRRRKLQSYILSTTTETNHRTRILRPVVQLQSYILSTTTETLQQIVEQMRRCRFNRTSFQQQLKPINKEEDRRVIQASIVHPFNNNWNLLQPKVTCLLQPLQSYIRANVHNF